jgi:hypothetical protein
MKELTPFKTLLSYQMTITQPSNQTRRTPENIDQQQKFNMDTSSNTEFKHNQGNMDHKSPFDDTSSASSVYSAYPRNQTPHPSKQSTLVQNHTLRVDFSPLKFTSSVASDEDPSTPLYSVKYRPTKPHMLFKSCADGSTIGTGVLHPVSIHADCEVDGKSIALRAEKRFQTSYSHTSYAYSDTERPVTMTWRTSCDLKTWDFICLDPEQNPVAKFSTNVWRLKHTGQIEFLGERAGDAGARDEIVVVAMTLFYCMCLRSSNFFNLVGAVFARTGQDAKGEHVVAAPKSLAEGEKL